MDKPIEYEIKIRQSPEFALRELSAHFDYNNAVWRTLQRLAKSLDEANIPYMLVGAMALNQHGYERATTDVDLIMTADGLAQFREQFLGRGYRPQFDGAQKTFRDTDTQVRIEVIVSGGYPGDGKPKPVSFPDPSQAIVLKNVRVVPLEKLIELKLASGLSAAHRIKDIADTQEMIRALNLPLVLADRLDTSVRDEYVRLWHTLNDATDPYDEEAQLKREKRDQQQTGAPPHE